MVFVLFFFYCDVVFFLGFLVLQGVRIGFVGILAGRCIVGASFWSDYFFGFLFLCKCFFCLPFELDGCDYRPPDES